ncbi:MAG: hypothetical protein ABI877_08515, partial [Gemmatimonadaceae bacterium]
RRMTYSSQGPPGWCQLKVVEIPPDPTFGIAVNATAQLAVTLSPRLIIVSGSYNTFPPDLVALHQIARGCGARLVYDAAHVSLYGATGLAENPFTCGVDALVTSTHKILGGPIGGLVLTPHRDLARALAPLSFPGFSQTRDQNKFAATVHALAEMVAFGRAYAEQTVQNARALAAALDRLGYRLLAKSRGYTSTHQLFVDLGLSGP